MREILKLNKTDCKNCYKCIRHCPVKSIRFSGNQAHIIDIECILCGQCFVVCPQDAKKIVEDVENVKVLLYGGDPVIASVAPSFVANFDNVGIEALEAALKKLGFHSAEETAIGATMVKKEYENMLKKGDKDIVISSCCHSINLLIQKYFPENLKYLADVVSPMQAHCLDIKKRHPNAKTVFIGPCISKKDEAQRLTGIVDYVLTFDELSKWLEAEGITLEQKKEKKEESKARFFPTSGGILKTMDCSNEDYKYIAIDGMEKCIETLEDIKKGNVSKCFVEMSACAGSCIGGPVMEKYNHSPLRDYMEVADYAGKKDFKVAEPVKDFLYQRFLPIQIKKSMPTDEQLQDILKKMGKNKPEDELNCGSCGYNTCRDKAVAVHQGKANLSMCLPFLKDKAETFSDIIIHNTPNGIVVVNENLEVQQINKAARAILNIRQTSDILGEPVVRILDPKVFMEVRASGKPLRNRRAYLPEYNKYVEETVIYDRANRVIIYVMRDITEEEEQAKKKEDMRYQTIQTADKVVDKQMRIVQEIASLLGETAAETKIALTKLKESISDE
ncbi:iron only hydrogenase large subunit-like protein/uncharacterized Fe-S cluster-containing protein [Elusimicrobium simillimum]|uniref:[Fe-Fe] hydrogenase large subunit C-terminal domain-containing protein n=1 Tax=Elusimicrobium simillimum TaxID=3143438 RepID=UPI003C6F4F70